MLKPPSATCPVIPSVGAVAPVAASAVRISSGFWHIRQELNTTKLLDHCDTWIESMGWYDTFRRRAGGRPDAGQGAAGQALYRCRRVQAVGGVRLGDRAAAGPGA